jgi:hypothetical protein
MMMTLSLLRKYPCSHRYHPSLSLYRYLPPTQVLRTYILCTCAHCTHTHTHTHTRTLSLIHSRTHTSIWNTSTTHIALQSATASSQSSVPVPLTMNPGQTAAFSKVSNVVEKVQWDMRYSRVHTTLHTHSRNIRWWVQWKNRWNARRSNREIEAHRRQIGLWKCSHLLQTICYT